LRRNPGVTGPAKTAQALRLHLVGDPFLTAPHQWGVVHAVHGATSTVLYAQATPGATSIQTTAAPVVNDLLLLGSLQVGLQVVSVSGSAAPFTVDLKRQVPSVVAKGAAVTAMHTLDVYFDGTQHKTATYLTVGVRYLSTYTPTAGDVVVAIRGTGNLASDRVILGKLA